MNTSEIRGDAFTIKYDLYSNMIFKLSFVYLHNPMDCEDVMHDVFIKLLQKGETFKSAEHEKRWILRITVNCCIDRIRKGNRHKTLPLEEYMIDSKTKEDQELVTLILNLPNKIKGPIHLYYFEGYAVNEIAKILGISVSAVKMRLKRGREMLKDILEEEEYGR